VSGYLQKYLDLGLSEIVSIKYDSHEEQSGFQAEDTYEIVVARKGNSFVKVSLHDHKAFGPGQSGFISVDDPTPIQKEEYTSLSAGFARMDTPEALERIAESTRREGRRQKLEDQLSSLVPKCGKCGGPMIRRYSRHGYFWGCQGYPRCDGTAKFSSAVKKLQDAIESL
jgi:hypothetical protein